MMIKIDTDKLEYINQLINNLIARTDYLSRRVKDVRSLMIGDPELSASVSTGLIMERLDSCLSDIAKARDKLISICSMTTEVPSRFEAIGEDYAKKIDDLINRMDHIMNRVSIAMNGFEEWKEKTEDATNK